MDDWDRGRWCDICHQKHYQIHPPCLEERRRREREWTIESVIGSQALSGILVKREEAERLYDEVQRLPMPKIGEERDLPC